MRYLLISFFRKPGGQIDEQARFVKKLKTSDLSMSNIIIDYGLKKVDKCVIEGQKLDRTFEQLNEYYRQIYPSIVMQLEKEGPIIAKAKNTD